MTSTRGLVSRLGLLTLGALTSLGCGGGDGATPMTDAGFRVVDSGEAPDSPDAFVAPDAGDGICGESLSPTGWAPLPASCLPRCTHETQTAINACAGRADVEDCIGVAISADMTPSTHVRVGSYVLEVSCGGTPGTAYSCLEWQLYSCESESCPAEYNAYATCAGGGAPCTTEQDALVACARASAEFATCARTRAPACNAS
jgi:hypothetical protein